MNERVSGLVLAVHPTSRGFGWVVFEAKDDPVAWGIASARTGRDEKVLNRFCRLLKKYEPGAFILEDYEAHAARRSERIRALCREMQHLAALSRCRLAVLDRDLIRAQFAREGAKTRYEIASAIAERIGAFAHRLPRYRKPWLPEDSRQSLFDAAALAMTYLELRAHA